MFGRVIFILALLCFFTGLKAQNDPAVGLQGLVDRKGVTHYEWAGYAISVEKINTPVKEKDISKLKKKYKIKGIIREDVDNSIVIIESETDFENEGIEYPEIRCHRLFYVYKSAGKQSDLIILSKIGERDIDIEEQFLDLYESGGLSDYIDPIEVDYIYFAGRTIQLGNLCEWRFPNNINCKGGQINWSVFDSYEKASEHTGFYIFKNRSERLTILEDIDIPVLFEGESVMARRIVYKQPDSWGYRSYPLIVYYVSSEVRGNYVSCTMSHYGHNKNDYELPDLLTEIMQIEEIPGSAWNKYNVPEQDELSAEQNEEFKNRKEEYKFKHYWVNLKSGIYLPFGGQRDFTATSTYLSLGFYLNGFSDLDSFLKSNSTIFFDLGFVIPSGRKHFNYYEKKDVIDAKTDFLANMYFGYIHKKKIKSQLYWENHIKIGIAGLITNKKKPGEEEESYSVGVFTMGIGSNIRYKRVGVFLDYQYAPYSKSKHLEAGGDSALLLGLNFIF